MKRKTVVITGAGGMLGEAVVGQFSDSWDVRPYPGDVTDYSVVSRFVKRVRPDAVIHLAALTDLEYCESHPAEAFAVNAFGTGNILASAIERDIPFVYISTAGIFNGKKKSYRENDIPDPLSIYGKSKYAGEAIASGYAKSIIVRGGWMMGGGPKRDKKFVNKIIQRINKGTTKLEIVDDKVGSLTYSYDMARTIEFLFTKKAYGIYHCACDGGVSRFEIAKFLVKKLGLEKKVSVVKVSSSHWNKEYIAPRPASERLSTARLKKLKASLIRPWRVVLADYLERFRWIVK